MAPLLTTLCFQCSFLVNQVWKCIQMSDPQFPLVQFQQESTYIYPQSIPCDSRDKIRPIHLQSAFLRSVMQGRIPDFGKGGRRGGLVIVQYYIVYGGIRAHICATFFPSLQSLGVPKMRGGGLTPKTPDPTLWIRPYAGNKHFPTAYVHSVPLQA